MKTKLSFLAFALCLGVALTFALSACDSGSGSKHEETSSSSKGGGDNFSSARESEQIRQSGFGFTVNTNSDKVELSGTFSGSPDDPIKSLEFSPSGWVKYDGQVRNSVITMSVPSVNLSNKDTEVDLLNSSIDCGARQVKVTACAAKNGNEENCSEYIYRFEKPASYCVSSSSANILSSSSQAMWKFGSKSGPVEVTETSQNSQKEIPGFSAKFTLKEIEVNTVDEMNMSISGGNIRWLNMNWVITFSGGYPEAGKPYPNNILGITESQSSMKVELEEYYIISASGSDKYLVRVETESGNPGAWPKKVFYWKVDEGPNL